MIDFSKINLALGKIRIKHPRSPAVSVGSCLVAKIKEV